MKILHLDRDGGLSLYQQIYADLRAQILRGEIPAGERLPSYRFMCRKYNINLATVAKAYDLLESNNYIERCHGSGCFVLPLDTLSFYADGVVLDSFERGQSEHIDDYDFATSSPVPDAEETKELMGCIDELAVRSPETLFRYPPTRGAPALIEALQTRIAAHGVDVPAENIHVIGGSQQGIDLICKSLIRKNSVVLVEEPSYSTAINCFQRAGAQVKTVPMEQDGPEIGSIEALLAHTPIDFYYTMPRFHCPTNVVWSAEKRHALLALAKRHGFMIIEDDCLGSLWFNEPQGGTFFADDADGGSVIHINSFSKSFAPGLRLGFMIAPGSCEKRLIMAKYSADIASPALLQEALAIYLSKGLYEKHMKRLRAIFAAKRAAMMEALQGAKYLTLPCGKYGGGVFFWVRLPEGLDSTQLWNRLLRKNVKIQPSLAFCRTGTKPNYIRLSFVGCETERIPAGVALIDAEVAAQLNEFRAANKKD